MRSVLSVAVIMLLVFVAPARAGNKDFSAQFDSCEEFVGIGYVPTARARPLVPARYTLAGDAKNALLVVRVASCSAASVDGQRVGAARTAQIGVMLNVPDSDANIDNYTLWFATDSGNLHAKLQAAGVKTSNTNQLSYAWQPSHGAGPLPIDVRAANFPTVSLRGNAQTPNYGPQGFIANWYADGQHGSLRMQTSFQVLRFGDAKLALTAAAGSDLAKLLDATTLSFVPLNSHNNWETATMQATLQ